MLRKALGYSLLWSIGSVMGVVLADVIGGINFQPVLFGLVLPIAIALIVE